MTFATSAGESSAPRRTRRRADRCCYTWWCGLLASGVAGCSLTTLEESPCSTDIECRDNFGLGSTCRESGLCSSPQLHPRCTESYPAGLLDDPTVAQTHHLMGTLFDGTNETHQVRVRSAQLAVSQINREGGLNDKPFALVQCSIEPGLEGNQTTTAEGAVSAALYLSDTLKLPAVIGPATSSDVLSVFEALRGSGTFMISPSATSPALTSADNVSASDDNPGLLWRTAPPDSLQGEAIATNLTARGVESVAVVLEQGAYGEGLHEFFRSNYAGFSNLQTYSNRNQWSTAVASAGVSSAEEVLFIASSQGEVRDFLQAVERNAAFDNKDIFLTDSAATRSVVEQIPEPLSSRIRGTRPSQLTDSEFNFGAFSSAYSAEYDGQDVAQFSYAAHTYDATWVTMLGIAWAELRAGKVSGEAIARGARQLSEGEETEFVPSKWHGILQAFRNEQSVNVVGTSGPIDFDPLTEETSAPIDIWSVQVLGGRPTLVVDETIQPAAALSASASP